MSRLRETEGVTLQITGFNDQGFFINDKIAAQGPIAIFPKAIYSWNIADESEINEKSLSIFPLIEPKLGSASFQIDLLDRPSPGPLSKTF